MDTPQPPDRRAFLHATALGAGALAGRAPADAAAPPAAPPAAGVPGFARGSAALQPDGGGDSACQFCNSNCGLKVGLKAGRVIDVAGRADDPVQAGGLCVKGPMMAQLVYTRHRLKT